MIDLQNPRTFTDELLGFATASEIARHSSDPVLVDWFAKVDAEAARRAEIRINRWNTYFMGNPFGFTLEEISLQHDAAWYEPRPRDESEPCMSYRDEAAVTCGHRRGQHDEDGCRQCSCLTYRSDIDN